MSHPFQSIIFDFDYTLADSSLGILASANFALAALGLPVVSAAILTDLSGLTAWLADL